MTLLAGLLDVLLRGISLIAFATAVGGVAYVLWALRPLQEWTAHLAGFVQRALRLITGAAFTLAGVQALVVFVLHPWTLADEAGRWPLAALLHTDYARTGLITIALALCLGALGRTLMLGHGPCHCGPGRSRWCWPCSSTRHGWPMASAASRTARC